jgi:hypothetical protein
VRDEHVDRRQVEAWQHVQPSRTNRPSGLTHPRLTREHPTPPNLPLPVALFSLPCVFFLLHESQQPNVVGGHGTGETPVPFPNTAVKPRRADGTAGPPVGEYVAANLSCQKEPASAFTLGAGSLHWRWRARLGRPSLGLRAAAQGPPLGTAPSSHRRRVASLEPAQPRPGHTLLQNPLVLGVAYAVGRRILTDMSACSAPSRPRPNSSFQPIGPQTHGRRSLRPEL